METKKIVIIVILAIVICVLAGAMYAMMTTSVDYERIEITPNGTSIEIPTAEAEYDGEMNDTGAKMWTFKQGSLVTFNSEEAIAARGLYGLGGAIGIKTIEELVLNHFEKREEIDGFTVYTIDGEKLGIEGRGEMYCIITGNNDTHDNIVITADNKDIALHMAKSIKYKTTNSTNNNSNGDTTSSSKTQNNNGNDNDNDDKHKYTEEDLERANKEGYDSGYSDGYSDSNDNYQNDGVSDFETTSESSSSRPNVVDGDLE